jgi:hypothetical protein
MPLRFIGRSTLFLDFYRSFPIFLEKKLFQKFFFSKFCWAPINYLENKPKYVKKSFLSSVEVFLALKNVFFSNHYFYWKNTKIWKYCTNYFSNWLKFIKTWNFFFDAYSEYDNERAWNYLISAKKSLIFYKTTKFLRKNFFFCIF